MNSETRLISVVAEVMFREFPKNIPSELKAAASIVMNEIDKNKKVYQEINPKTGLKVNVNRVAFDTEYTNSEALKNIDPLTKRYAMLIIETYIAQIGQGKRGAEIDGTLNIPRLLIYQNFVMLFSNFEGILADSFRAICLVKPEVLKKDKMIRVEEVLSTKSWDGLISMLIDKAVLDMGYQNLQERIETFEKLFGLKINLKEDEKLALKIIDLTRNTIVHNAGKATEELKKIVPQANIGEYIQLDEGFIESVSSLMDELACEIFLQISVKHYNIPKTEVKRCVRLFSRNVEFITPSADINPKT